MKIQNLNFSQLNILWGVILVILTMTVSAQLANGQPQLLSIEELDIITGGGDCEGCETDTNSCKTSDATTCDVDPDTEEGTKKVYTGQDEILEKTGLDTGVIDAKADTLLKCYEQWTGCIEVGGACLACDAGSTTSKVNTNCNHVDGNTCPAGG